MSNDDDDEDPVTIWIDDLRNSDDSAASKIWNHFMQRLHDLARRKLRPETRRVYDEEDAAQSAFNSFCAGIALGRFPDLRDRESLCQLLLVITARKVAHRHRYDGQLRRDVRRTQSELIFSAATAEATQVDALPSPEPTPEFVAEFVDVCELLMNSLNDADLQKVATLRMEGYKDSEIADRLDCSRSTVQRRLEVIRRNWQELDLLN
ncbi:MAG: helix-turn-helix domain-containing protein [Planctomycetales bacterium]|nr:helix-turn-helix domain-containing protein [Planctomycetales bacterium]